MKFLIVIFALLGGPVWAAEPFSTVDKWAKVSQEIDRDREALAACRRGEPCPVSATRFLSIIESVRELSGLTRIGHLNRAINGAIRPHNEIIDVWSSPLATFESGEGDCEDYAIAKLVALLEIDVPRENIRLVVLRGKNADHVVISVLIDGDWRVMNNLTLVLLKESEMRGFHPKYIIQP